MMNPLYGIVIKDHVNNVTIVNIGIQLPINVWVLAQTNNTVTKMKFSVKVVETIA